MSTRADNNLLRADNHLLRADAVDAADTKGQLFCSERRDTGIVIYNRFETQDLPAFTRQITVIQIEQ